MRQLATIPMMNILGMWFRLTGMGERITLLNMKDCAVMLTLGFMRQLATTLMMNNLGVGFTRIPPSHAKTCPISRA